VETFVAFLLRHVAAPKVLPAAFGNIVRTFSLTTRRKQTNLMALYKCISSWNWNRKRNWNWNQSGSVCYFWTNHSLGHMGAEM